MKAKQLFEKIGRSDIDESMSDLLYSGVIDSIEIMELLSLISTELGRDSFDIFMKNLNAFYSLESLDSFLSKLKEDKNV